MIIFQLILVFLSAILLGAHFLRAGLIPLAVLALLFPALLFFMRAWTTRLVQIILILGTIEWIRTLLVLVAERRANGQSWSLLAIIIGLVAVLSCSSALMFSLSRPIRKICGLKNPPTEECDRRN